MVAPHSRAAGLLLSSEQLAALKEELNTLLVRREKGGGVWREIGVQCRAATSEASTQHPNPNPDGEAEASFRSNNAGESHAQRNGLAAYTWRAERLSSIYQATHAGYVSDMSAQTDAPGPHRP